MKKNQDADMRYSASKIIIPGSPAVCGDLIIEGGRITRIVKKTIGHNAFAYAVPGFIDIHNHGGFGIDINNNADEKTIDELCGLYLKKGTTSLMLSTTTAPLDKLKGILECGRRMLSGNTDKSRMGEAAHLLGFHLEGPWISAKNAGAQPIEYIIEPDENSRKFIIDHKDIIRMATISCHTEKHRKFASFLKANGIIAACGHDTTCDTDAEKAFTAGIDHITHIFSNSASFQRINGFKHLGSLEMALMTPGIKVEVIADNRHITRHFWNFITHNKAFEDIIVVSDASPAACINAQKSTMGGKNIIIDQGVAWQEDKSGFAGSISTMHDIFKILAGEWNVPVEKAACLCAGNQAARLGIDHFTGSLVPGKIADILFLDENLAIKKILKSGREVNLS
ncbi:MAG: hypothetical protein A2096_10500 [Spirochaetes bacterium GWF1_41_5]|nr:MAG: hypothetical protein A2096_10500 [Spirochaetes bacterium GWF1_41_5]HBE04432.1 hypothetical protein [Spirochaetia bacterium]